MFFVLTDAMLEARKNRFLEDLAVSGAKLLLRQTSSPVESVLGDPL